MPQVVSPPSKSIHRWKTSCGLDGGGGAGLDRLLGLVDLLQGSLVVFGVDVVTSLADVLEDFRVNTGTQFEPAVVCAFCRAFLKEIEGTSKERRLMKLLGKNYDNVESVSPILSQLISELDGNGDMRAASAVGH